MALQPVVSDRDDTVAERMFNAQLNSRFWYVVGGVLVLLIGAVVLGGVVTQNKSPEAFRFIGLLIIAMAGLATTAAVFTGLRLGSREEAFGLPSGSIRALLAIGVMVLFVVFALPVVDPDDKDAKRRLADTPLASIEAVLDTATLTREVERYRAQGLTVIVRNYGRAGIPQSGTAAEVAPVPARFDVYATTTAPTREATEASNQLITALITLLTSIVSFYFGSKSAVDASRGAAGTPAPTDTTVELALIRKKVADELELLTAEEAAWQSAVTAARALTPPANPAELADFTTTLTTAETALKTYVEARDAVRATLAQADQSLATVRNDSDARTRPLNEAEARRVLDNANVAIGTMRGAADALRTVVLKLDPGEG